MFEYSVLGCLRGNNYYHYTFNVGLKHVCSAHDFVKNPEQNLIVMDLLGKCSSSRVVVKVAIF